MSSDTAIDEMRSVAIRGHATQSRNGGRVPYSFHVLSVAEIVRQLLDDSGECTDPALARDVYLAAMGHDLYEDTDVTRDEIKTRFGARVDSFISGMTNRNGDADRAAYERDMGHAAEEIRLIKLSDLIDNVLSCAYGIHDLGREWIVGTFLPIAEGMTKIVKAAKYARYPKTAARALDLLDFAMSRLRSNLGVALAIDMQQNSGQRARSRELLKNFDGKLKPDPDAERKDEERLAREGRLTKGMRAFVFDKK